MRILINKEAVILGSRWVVATVLAYSIIQYFNVFKGFFSLITVAAVIQLSPSDTCIRSIMRVSATIMSAFLTYCLLSVASGQLFILIPGCLLISFFAGYAIFQSEVTRYFHVMLGIIMICVILFSQLTSVNLTAALTVIKLVLIGSFCVLITDIVFYFFTKQKVFTKAIAKDFCIMFTTLADQEKRRSRMIIALQLCIAIAITLIPWLIFQYHDGFWVAISCFFVVEELFTTVVLKSRNRFFAHLISAIAGSLIILLTMKVPEIRIWLFLLCIFMIAIFMVNKEELALTGNTMGIALVIMVFGGGDDTVIYRFAYTTIGIIVGLAVCAVFSKTRLLLKNHYV